MGVQDAAVRLTEEVDSIHRPCLGQVRHVFPPVIRISPEAVDQHHRGTIAALQFGHGWVSAVGSRENTMVDFPKYDINSCLLSATDRPIS